MERRRHRRIANAEWESHKQTIQQLYMNEYKRLEGPDGVMDIMKTAYGFTASKAQYETRLKKWNFRKYAKRDEWLTLLNILDNRKEKGKETEVLFDGKPVDPARVRKETGRHRKRKNEHTYSQAQDLASYITVRTPPLSHASLASQLRAYPPLPQFGQSSSESITKFTFEDPSGFGPGVSTGFLDIGYQPIPLSSQSDTFDALWNSSVDESSLRGRFGAVHQRESGANLGSLQFSANGLIGGDCFDLDNLDFTTMDPAVVAPASSSMVAKDIQPLPGQFTLTNHLIKKILPVVEQLMRKIRVPTREISGFPIEKLCHPTTSQLLRRQSIDIQILHLVTSRLINNDALSGLQNPQSSIDKLYRAGVEHLFTLEAPLLGEILDSTPFPYNTALEEGLFCAAIEMGAGKTVEAILKRGFNADKPFNFHGFPHYPLERSCHRLSLEVTSILIKFGANPRRYIGGNILTALVCGSYCSDQRRWIHPPGSFELTDLLLKNGATIDPARLPYLLGNCHSRMIPVLVGSLIESGSTMFILNGGLAKILDRKDLGDQVLTRIKIILEHDYPDSVRSSTAWRRALTEALTKAYSRGKVETVELLLAAGALPEAVFLIDAVRSQNMHLVKRFLNLGVDPNRFWGWVSGEYYPCTAMSECIRTEFGEAFQLFDRRGFVSKVGDTEQSFKLALVAACKVGYENLVDYLLTLQWHDGRMNLNGALNAAIEAGQEMIVRKLLAAGICPNSESLHIAVKNRQVLLVKLLAETAEFTLENQSSILLEALWWGNKTVIKELIHAGAPFNGWHNIHERHVDIGGGAGPSAWIGTPLSAAILNGDREVTNFLLESGVHLNPHGPYLDEDDSWTMTALTATVANRDVQLFQNLLTRGADPFDNSAIFIAAILAEKNILEAHLDAFTKRYPHGVKSFGAEALLWAIESGKKWMVELLVRSTDANVLVDTILVDTRDLDADIYRLKSPLCAAMERDWNCGEDFETLRLLLQNGGDPDGVVFVGEYNGDEKTALLYAIEQESLQTVKVLIKAGADLSLPARWRIKRTPLQAAAEGGNNEIIAYLLQHGADPNEAPAIRTGATALQLAAIEGYVGIAKTLLEANANVNAEPAMIDGRTAFEGATEHGRIEMMLFLFQNGADLLSNDRRQYQRAIRFAEKNCQGPAKQLADRLLDIALRNEATRTIAEHEVGMTGLDMDNFSEFISFDG